MGMAAGQARLLSITSRMSDNELRAQMINNDKMRLATKSSQVSEAYVQALNDSKMMFTNYDKNNNASYEQLTFNSLTAFNQYNNQYAISNAAGQIIVSEKDANNYKVANGDLTKFLSMYGLEKTTTYFDTLGKYADKDGKIPYSTGLIDDAGNIIQESSGLTPEELQAYYEGIQGSSIHPGYNVTVASSLFYDFSKHTNNFDEAYTNWSRSIANNMDNYFKKLNPYIDPVNNPTKQTGTIADIENGILEANSTNDLIKVLDNLDAFIKHGYEPVIKEDQTATKYVAFIHKRIGEIQTSSDNYNSKDNATAMTYTKNGNIETLMFGESNDGKEISKENRSWALTRTNNGAGNYTWSLTAYSDPQVQIPLDNSNIVKSKDGKNLTINFDLNEGDSKDHVIIEGIPNIFGTSTTNETKNVDYNIRETHTPDLSEMKEDAKSLLKDIKNSIYTMWDTNNVAFTSKSDDPTIYNNYVEKGKILSEFLLGTDIGPKSYPNLLDMEWILNHKAMTKDRKTHFQPIFDVIMLDNVMNTYGEPKYAWIDKNDQNANGEAKAQWYTNLFNRMKDGGYNVLQYGLASSIEWIKSSFESGLITLEQVDNENNWNTTIYSNCSDITEQPDNKATAVAEAEYNAAMKKIENKDKKFDMELKNIDTEHNSLQTEYDSIKGAIDKNIERSFKIYG